MSVIIFIWLIEMGRPTITMCGTSPWVGIMYYMDRDGAIL